MLSLVTHGKDFIEVLEEKPTDFKNLSGDWEIHTYDVDIPKEGIEYEIELDYTGECRIKQQKNYLTFVGDAEGVIKGENNIKSKRYHWDFNGIGIIHTDYIGVYYHLYPKKGAETCGVLLLKTDVAGEKLKGFFLAKRALEGDEIGKKQGFGFGPIAFIRK